MGGSFHFSFRQNQQVVVSCYPFFGGFTGKPKRKPTHFGGPPKNWYPFCGGFTGKPAGSTGKTQRTSWIYREPSFPLPPHFWREPTQKSQQEPIPPSNRPSFGHGRIGFRRTWCRAPWRRGVVTVRGGVDVSAQGAAQGAAGSTLLGASRWVACSTPKKAASKKGTQQANKPKCSFEHPCGSMHIQPGLVEAYQQTPMWMVLTSSRCDWWLPFFVVHRWCEVELV